MPQSQSIALQLRRSSSFSALWRGRWAAWLNSPNVPATTGPISQKSSKANQITIHRFTAPQIVEFLRIMARQMGGVAELAKRTGYDRANLDKIIKGKRKPTARLLAKLSIHEERSYVWTATTEVKVDASRSSPEL